MAYWDMTKKMRNHASLLPGEICHEAVYGLGRGAVGLADQVGGTRGRYGAELDAAGEPSRANGIAESIGTKTGVAAITSQRFLFIMKKIVIGKPGVVDVEVPIQQVADVTYERPILVISFVDGSAVRLHVPRSQKPGPFVDAFRSVSLE